MRYSHSGSWTSLRITSLRHRDRVRAADARHDARRRPRGTVIDGVFRTLMACQTPQS
jgi:hypothetical protein